MRGQEKPKIGKICWQDLTVGNADEIRQFYSNVAGWKSEPVNMGQYEDFNMIAAETGEPAAGICHARNANANLPPQWLIYIAVEDADACAERCQAEGGEVVDWPRAMGQGRFCVIKAPAGAVCALIRP